MKICFEIHTAEELAMVGDFFVKNRDRILHDMTAEEERREEEVSPLLPPFPSSPIPLLSYSPYNPPFPEEEKREEDSIGGRRKKIEPKQKYGSFENVMLTDKELAKLREKFSDADDKIEIFSQAKEAKGYKYKSDYAAILKWHWDDSKKFGPIPAKTLKTEYKSTYQRLKEMGQIYEQD